MQCGADPKNDLDLVNFNVSAFGTLFFFYLAKTTQRITMLEGYDQYGSGKNPLNYGADPNQGVDPGISFPLSLTFRDRAA